MIFYVGQTAGHWVYIRGSLDGLPRYWRVRLRLEVAGDELGHLEHGDRFLAVEYRLELFVGVDLGPDFFVLEPVLFNVSPDFFG